MNVTDEWITIQKGEEARHYPPAEMWEELRDLGEEERRKRGEESRCHAWGQPIELPETTATMNRLIRALVFRPGP